MQDFSRKKWMAFVALALGALWIWLNRVPSSAISGTLEQPRQGFQAPLFTLPTNQGEVVSLEELRGKAVIINLWTSWCPPCRAEMPAMQEVYEDYHQDGLEILAVNSTIQDSAEAAQAFVEEYQLSFPILFDMDGKVSSMYQLQSLPTSFFVDRQGIIREVVIGGPMAEALLRIRVQQLLESSP